MKKNILLTLILLLAILNCYSQKTDHRNFISFSAGPSFPVGKYADKNMDDHLPGFAKIGEQLNISFEHTLDKNFGIAVMLHGQRNGVDIHSLEQQYSQKKFPILSSGNSGEPPPPVTYSTIPSWKFNKSSWLSASLLAGITREFPFHQKNNFSIITKAMMGAIYVSTPKLSGSSITDTVIAGYAHNSVDGFGFAYLFSGGLKYTLNKKINLLFNINYSGTSAIQFKKSKTTSFVERNPRSLPTVTESTFMKTDNKNIGSININFGIELRL